MLPTTNGVAPEQPVTGTVVRWCGGFGFVKPDDGGEDLFCHFTSIRDGNMLKEGAAVQFVKKIDERKGREQAFDLIGGCTGEEEPFRRGGGGRGRGAGGGGVVTMDPPPGKLQGTVSRWTAKGYGFITPDDGGEDLFCHFSKIEDGNALSQGARVHFVKWFDNLKGNHRAVEVVGGFHDGPDRHGSGYGGK